MTTATHSGCEACRSVDAIELMQFANASYVQCNQCELIRAAPMPQNYGEVNEEAFADNLEKYIEKTRTKRRAAAAELKRFDHYRTEANSTGRFLEIGCNTGTVVMAAGELGWDAAGVDISAAATAFARDTLQLNVTTGSVENQNYPDNHFDLIYSNAVFEHLFEPMRTLKEAVRILRPGGVLYADTVNWASYTRERLGNRWRYLDPEHHIHLYTPANVRNLAEAAGFAVQRIWTTGVRLTPRGESTPWYEPFVKLPLSIATRANQKGDSIEFLLRKP